jgi:hypothetical protein
MEKKAFLYEKYNKILPIIQTNMYPASIYVDDRMFLKVG